MQEQNRYNPSTFVKGINSKDILGKVPPNSPEAERAGLGAILLNDKGLLLISSFRTYVLTKSSVWDLQKN